MQFTAKIELKEDGWYYAKCDQRPDIFTIGKTYEEAVDFIKDAIQITLEHEKELGIKRRANNRNIRREVITIEAV
jgi:predicted RNase H-like HicB family nuclease